MHSSGRMMSMDILAESDIEVGSNIEVISDIEVGSNIEVISDIEVGSNIEVISDIEVGSNIEVISDIGVGSNVEIISDTKVKKEKHKAFAEEAFIYLFDHFGIQPKTQDNFKYFTEETGYALITLAYVYRRRLRTLIRNAPVDLANIEDFFQIAKNFEVLRDEIYFFYILKRLSHIFELTAYCWNEGHDYLDAVKEFIEIDSDIEYFKAKGGLICLKRVAMFIANAGTVFRAIINHEKPQDLVLRSFVRAVHDLEMPFGDIMEPVQKGMLSVIKREVMTVVPNLDNSDLRLLKIYYQAICQHSSKLIAMNRINRVQNVNWKKHNLELEKITMIYSFRNIFKIILGDITYLNLRPAIKLAECFGFFRHLSDLISPVLETEEANVEIEVPEELSEEEKKCYSLKECFVVSNDYVTERLRVQNAEQRPPVRQQVGVTYSFQPTLRKMKSHNVKKVIDANIAMNNFFRMRDGRYTIHTPDCKFDETTTTVFFD